MKKAVRRGYSEYWKVPFPQAETLMAALSTNQEDFKMNDYKRISAGLEVLS